MVDAAAYQVDGGNGLWEAIKMEKKLVHEHVSA